MTNPADIPVRIIADRRILLDLGHAVAPPEPWGSTGGWCLTVYANGRENRLMYTAGGFPTGTSGPDRIVNDLRVERARIARMLTTTLACLDQEVDR